MSFRLIFPIVSICLFLLILFYLVYTNYTKNKDYEFEGKIDSISYNEKGVPSIIIQGKVYSFSPKREFKNMVHIGDLAIKHKGEMKVKFIDQYSKKYAM